MATICPSSEQQVDRPAYTLCVMERLQEALRRHDVFVSPSERWGDPRAKLLQGAAWDAVRTQVCRTLGRQEKPEKELASLQQQLQEAYQRTAANLPTVLAPLLAAALCTRCRHSQCSHCLAAASLPLTFPPVFSLSFTLAHLLHIPSPRQHHPHGNSRQTTTREELPLPLHSLCQHTPESVARLKALDIR